MSASICLLLLGSFGFVAPLQYWDQGLTLPPGCFVRNRSEERCEETLRNSDVYNVLEELYERSPAGRENFRAKVRSCAEKTMLQIDFLYLCDSMKFSRRAVKCIRKVAASRGPPSFKDRVRELYTKYWECVEALFKKRKFH